MTSKHALKASGLVLAAVVLAMFTVQGSYALWNKSAGSGAGTVQAADFRISLTDTQASRVTEMTLPDGTAATLALSSTAAGALMPGQSSYAGVQVNNLTDAGGDFTVRAGTAPAVVTNNPGSTLAQYLAVKTVTAASLAQCSQAGIYGQAATSGTAMVDVPKNGSGVFCFQISLAADMPANVGGQSAQIAVPIVVNQL